MYFMPEKRLLATLFLCFFILWVDARVIKRDVSTVSTTSRRTASVTSTRSLPTFTLVTDRPGIGASDTKAAQTSSVTTSVATSNSVASIDFAVLLVDTSSLSSTTVATPRALTAVAIATPTSSSITETTAHVDSNQLPIPPRITPAFGIGGIILMFSGLVYAFVGIRFKWLHASLSAASLGALSVALLILHLANPSTSDAIQGAYLVAIVMTAVIIGGASYFFCNITEGLASLLGGFCFSMWLLVMRPGGLIHSSGGRTAFIIVFTIFGYATTFQNFTRDYSMLASIALNGATIIVLGIDCFAGAGLKEFWVYLLNVNPSLFPKGKSTYPLTKGMKGEIAAIAIVFLLALACQYQTYKVMQKRQTRRGSEKLDLEEGANSSREDIAPKKAIKVFEREVPQWQPVFQEKALPDPGQHPANRDSGFGAELNGKERWTTSTLRPSEFEISPMVEYEVYPISAPLAVIHSAPQSISPDSPKQAVTPRVVVSPSKGLNSDDDSDRASIATTVEEQIEMKQRSTRFSATSAFLRRLSKKSRRSSHGLYRGQGESSEDLYSLKSTDHKVRSSSIAATQDDLSDVDDWRSARSSYQMSPYRAEFKRSSSGSASSPRTPNFSHKMASSRLSRPFSGVTAASHLEADADAEPVPEIPAELKQEKKDATSSATEIKQPVTVSSSASEPCPSTKESSVANSVVTQPTIVLMEANLPQMSKAATSHRTDEWAKHLGTAEEPKAERDDNQHTRTVSQESEKPAPVNVIALQETASIPEPAIVRKPVPSSGSTKPVAARSKLSLLSHHTSSTSSLPRSTTSQRSDTTTKSKPPISNGTALASMPEFPPQASLSSSEAVSNLYKSSSHWSSHQPKYQPTVPNPILAREQRLASWRASLAQDQNSSSSSKSAFELSRNALVQERLAREHKRETAKKMKLLKQAEVDERMRRGEMMEAHRDALRKMQARANEAVQ